jgi:transposase
METIVRRSVGIDIAKATFTACVATQKSSLKLETSEVLQFENRTTGFNQFIKWLRKNKVNLKEVIFVMEATGIYYEPIAYHLDKLGFNVSVVLPNKVKHYAKSLNVKSKTDIIDAKIIAKMGAERMLPLWEPPLPVLKKLRDVTRLYSDLKAERTVFENKLQTVKAGNNPLDFIAKSIEAIICGLNKEIEKCEQQIDKTIASEPWLETKVKKLVSIKGVGILTVAIIVAETQGFKLVNNRKQLASYAGYDVVETESGTSIKARTRISKKGNSRIRAALYFPALVASRHNKQLKEVYNRINNKKSSKMIGVTAIQRKLLLLMFTLWKNDTEYDEKATNKTSGNQETKSLLRLNDAVVEKKQADQ